MDAVHDALDLTAASAEDDLVEFFILDVESAFWLVPLDPRERPYSVVKGWGFYWVFLCTPQGTRGAPLSWACLFALINRCAHSVLRREEPSAERSTIKHLDTGRMQTYVDDPLHNAQGPTG